VEEPAATEGMRRTAQVKIQVYIHWSAYILLDLLDLLVTPLRAQLNFNSHSVIGYLAVKGWSPWVPRFNGTKRAMCFVQAGGAGDEQAESRSDEG